MQLLDIQRSPPVELLQLVDSRPTGPSLELSHDLHMAVGLDRGGANLSLCQPIELVEEIATMGLLFGIWVAEAAQLVLSQVDWVALASEWLPGQWLR